MLRADSRVDRESSRAALFVAALLALALALAPRADAYVYWANCDTSIGRANLDGSAPNQSFIAGANDPMRGGGRRRARLLGERAATRHDRARQPRRHRRRPELHQRREQPRGVAVDGQHVYWANSRRHDRARQPRRLERRPELHHRRRQPRGWRSTARTSTGRTAAAAARSGAPTSTAPTPTRASSTGAGDPSGWRSTAPHVYWVTELSHTLDRAGQPRRDGRKPVLHHPARTSPAGWRSMGSPRRSSPSASRS